jgi:hypothetical protein
VEVVRKGVGEGTGNDRGEGSQIGGGGGDGGRGCGVDAGADSKPSSHHFESWPRSEWSKKLMHNMCHYTSHISHP